VCTIGTLFYIKVKHKVIVSPLHDYIENWLNSAFIKIIEKNQIEAVGIDEEIVARKNIRATTTQK
jgi:hypothetical protein